MSVDHLLARQVSTQLHKGKRQITSAIEVVPSKADVPVVPKFRKLVNCCGRSASAYKDASCDGPCS